MSITIYWASGSCPSWRVLFALELKGLAYESRLLDISKQQHKSADMLALNPRGKVPVMRDGDFALYESMGIVAYLEAKYPERPVLGRDPEQTGRIWRIWSEVTCWIEPAIDRVVIPIYRGVAAEQADAVRAAARDVATELARIETQLARTQWLVGDEPTAADGALIPQIGHLLRALGKPGVEELELEIAPFTRFPAITAWWERVVALPRFDRTYPPHWK